MARRRARASARTEPTSQADAPPLRVGILRAADDEAAAQRLNAFLRDAGVRVIDPRGKIELDGLVVLISPGAVADLAWYEAAADLSANRVIPVRMDLEVDADRVPDRIAAINWIDWRPDRTATTYGNILVGLYADPDRHRVAQQLAQRARAWEQAGRSADLLISDLGRAERMRERLEELEADPLASPETAIRPFVASSFALARREHRRRRRWRIAAALVLLGAAGVASTALPQIRSGSLINKAAIATAGDESVLANQPEWSAANAAALLMQGTGTQRFLGRATILHALGRPWTYSAVDYIDSIRSMVSFDRGRRGAVIALTGKKGTTGFVLVDLRTGRWVGRRILSGRYESIDVTPDSTTAIVAGDGIAAIDIATGRVRTLTSSGNFVGVRAGRDSVLGWASGGEVHLLGLTAQSVARRRYRAVLDIAEPRNGRASALVMTDAQRAAIIDVASGRVLARARVGPAYPTSSLSPDGTHAVMALGDGQFWRFGADIPLEATGIPVPIELNDVVWTRQNRLILASDSERGQVVLMSGGERLGGVCSGHPSPNEVRVDHDVDMLSCGGNGAAFWRIPAGPRARGAAGASSVATASNAAVAVETQGSKVRVRFRGAPAATVWSTPLNNKITAAKISPAGDQVALGSVAGGVAILGLTDHGFRIIGVWQTPDAAPVTALGWDGGPVATTKTRRHWAVPACVRCQFDDGLLDAVRSRNTSCLTERQLMWVSDAVRRRIDARVCQPVLKLEAG